MSFLYITHSKEVFIIATTYIANSDGSTQQLTGESGIAYTIRSPLGKVVYRQSNFLHSFDSMQTEFQAIIDLITKAINLKIPKLKIRTDCKRITDLVSGIGIPNMSLKYTDLFFQLANLISVHQGIEMEWVPRALNKLADKMSRDARKTGKGEEEQVENLDQRIQRSFVKQIVKRNTYIMMECKSCREKKSANQFPRRKVNNQRRSCFTCLGKLNAIHM